jgi:hypothetical protein
MKSLEKFTLNLPKCRRELADFRELLDRQGGLSERDEVLPFFKTHRHIAALIGAYNPRINRFDRIASEFDLFGDYTCDLAIGDSTSHNFCFVEFEDASPNSVFIKKRGKSTPEWSPRFEHGFSQILDWFRILEDQQRTAQFKARLGAETIQYLGLLVIGRRQFLDDAQYQRMRWRSEQVQVGARQVHCITFDELFQTLSLKLDIFG